MSTKDIHESREPAPPLGLGSSEGLGPLPLWRDDAGRSWWGADELTGEALLAWRDAAVAAERERWQSMLLSAVAEAEIHARQQREFVVKVDSRGWWCEWRA
jgi:hypothetical protein